MFAETRAFPEYFRFIASAFDPRGLARGDGHSVIVYPGLLAHDVLTIPLRSRLASLGYQPWGWTGGFNLGLRDGLLDAMLTQVEHVARDSGGKVSLIGWSLGGLYARELAKRLPGQVRCVITLGTPFAGDPTANNAWRIYEMFNNHSVTAPPIDTRLSEPPPVPTTSIYSADEGIVAVESSLNPDGPHLENVEINGSHCGLVWNADVLRIVADRLAQPEGSWTQYRK